MNATFIPFSGNEQEATRCGNISNRRQQINIKEQPPQLLSSDPTTGVTLTKTEALLYKGYTNKSLKATAEFYN